jgi:predicted extracellular nuclease
MEIRSLLKRTMPVFLALFSLLSSCYENIPQSGQNTPDDTTQHGENTAIPIVDPTSGVEISEIRSVDSIQGESHTSPYEGQFVENVYGIVTVTKSDGFFMQSAIPDDNPATSDGIFVFTDWIPNVRQGDAVLVSGSVEEFLPGSNQQNLTITRIWKSQIKILSRGNILPKPIILGRGGRSLPDKVIDDDTNGYVSGKGLFDPQNDGLDFFESLEGMLVQINAAVVVGPTNPYKEIVVLADMGIDSNLRTPRGGIVVREDDFNPERIILDDLLHATPLVQVGDYSEDPIICVMDYDFGNYRCQVIASPIFKSGGLSPESLSDISGTKNLRIASYNVMNLSSLERHRINMLADQIVNQMASPDIIGLQEIQDNDGISIGTVTADDTYQGIVDAILDLDGPLYGYIDIAPHPDADGGISGGNIRVGYLYRLDRGLRLIDSPHGDATSAIEILNESGEPFPSLNPGRIEPTHPAFYGSRKPLVLSFLFHDQPIFLINNHFVSKGRDTGLFGDQQPPLYNSEAQRLAQALVVHDFVKDILAVDPNARVVVMGDLNDFHFSTSLATLESEILNNLIKTLSENERYSYVYDGNSQVLDHILVSDSLLDRLVSVDMLHINSEFDYQTQFSDHDPIIATFDLP